MEYLKEFNTHSEYQTFINTIKYGSTVSLCGKGKEREIHFNPEPVITCKYNVTEVGDGVTTKICHNTSSFSKMLVDDVEKPLATTYAFDTVGEHTVCFLCKNRNSFGQGYAFSGTSAMTSIVYPNSFTNIDGFQMLCDCSSLSSITFPSNVKTIVANQMCVRTNVQYIYLPETLTQLGGVSLQSLKRIYIPDSVTGITGEAFRGARPTDFLYVGKNVSFITRYALRGQTANITAPIIFAPTVPPASQSDSICISMFSNYIYVPPKSLNAYKTSPYFTGPEFNNKIKPMTELPQEVREMLKNKGMP